MSKTGEWWEDLSYIEDHAGCWFADLANAYEEIRGEDAVVEEEWVICRWEEHDFDPNEEDLRALEMVVTKVRAQADVQPSVVNLTYIIEEEWELCVRRFREAGEDRGSMVGQHGVPVDVYKYWGDRWLALVNAISPAQYKEMVEKYGAAWDRK